MGAPTRGFHTSHMCLCNYVHARAIAFFYWNSSDTNAHSVTSITVSISNCWWPSRVLVNCELTHCDTFLCNIDRKRCDSWCQCPYLTAINHYYNGFSATNSNKLQSKSTPLLWHTPIYIVMTASIIICHCHTVILATRYLSVVTVGWQI